MKKLTIVIVSYNVRHYLEQCIDSVQRATRGIDCEVCVVDNHSSDDTVVALRQRYGDAITLVESTCNLGFSRANNLAIRQSDSQYVLLLNPDTFVAEDSLQQVLGFMDAHPNAGGVGVMMLGADGRRAPESRRGLPTPWVSLKKMLGFSSRYYMSHLPWDRPGQIDVISGAFCMLRRDVLDGGVGLLDEDFFMYGEDIDLSYRILKAGFENWYVPARIVHYKGESTQKSSFRYVHVFYQAMLIFFRKHYGHLSFLVTLPVRMAICFRALLALVQMQYYRMRQSLGFDHTVAVAYYCFVGAADMLEQCRRLAVRTGLEAQFVDAQACPQFHDMVSDGAVVVYDSRLFSYGQIIGHAMQLAPRGCTLGTYDTASQTLITSSAIIK